MSFKSKSIIGVANTNVVGEFHLAGSHFIKVFK